MVSNIMMFDIVGNSRASTKFGTHTLEFLKSEWLDMASFNQSRRQMLETVGNGVGEVKETKI